jgi:hypothetical protein
MSKKYVVKLTKELLLYKAKNAELRPAANTREGRALSNYTCKSSSCYDEVFDVAVRMIAPKEWFRNLDKQFVDCGEYVEIELTQGYFTKIDKDDLDKVQEYTWYYKEGYVDNSKVGKLHRYLMNPPDNLEIDHINGDGLDNRKVNLRICTHQQNIWNSKPRTNSTSHYKGVSFNVASNKWQSQIRVDGNLIHLGSFDDEVEAARAYDVAAIAYYGEYARLNFPREEYN